MSKVMMEDVFLISSLVYCPSDEHALVKLESFDEIVVRHVNVMYL